MFQNFASRVNKGEADFLESKAHLARMSGYNEKLKHLQIHDRQVPLGESIGPTVS